MTDQPLDVEIRSAELAAVDYPKRIIDLIVMPYERETEVQHGGRMIMEICSRGAYGHVQERARKISVNRDHNRLHVVGRAIELYPDREEGLMAEVKIARTQLGEETLLLADDEMLAASAGFALLRQNGGTGPIYPDAVVWENGGRRRRLNRLMLDHIAMTPEPAYPDARVLAVRHAVPAGEAGMPRRDQLRLDELAAVAASIDERYRSAG